MPVKIRMDDFNELIADNDNDGDDSINGGDDDDDK